MLDKLILKPSPRFELREFEAHLRRLGFQFRHEMLGGTFFCKRIIGTNGSLPIHVSFKPSEFGQSRCNQIITNPRHFASFNEFSYYMTLIFGPLVWTFPVSRLDSAIDLHYPFDQVVCWIDVAFKQKIGNFTESKSARLTSLTFGGGEHVVKAYCNELRTNKKKDIRPNNSTRLEALLIRRQIPGNRALGQVCTHIQSETFDPFRQVRMTPQTFNLRFESYDDVLRAQQLQIISINCGFGVAKRRLNQNRNFSRDFGKYIVPLGNPISVSALLKVSLQEWFKSLYKPPTLRHSNVN